MDDLKQYSLDELIERVTRESLIDSCERKDEYVIIVQGSTRFVLNPVRAHAFLRGVIKGMSVHYRGRWAYVQGDSFARDELRTPREERSSDLIGSFRRHLLKKWWERYEEANCPFGRSSTALMLWVRHNTNTTTN